MKKENVRELYYAAIDEHKAVSKKLKRSQEFKHKEFLAHLEGQIFAYNRILIEWDSQDNLIER